MRATMLLADAAQEVQGKLYVLGGGWNVLNTVGSPTAVAIHIHVPWDRTNMPHQWLLELLDSDGEPVVAPGPIGDQPIVVQGGFEVGRPAGVIPGSELGVSIAVNIGPLPLLPGERYVWRLSINGEPNDNWRLPFSVLRSPQQQAAAEGEEPPA